ncbi:MAG: inositol monophosphatase family protein [Halioglobus sp.]
MSQLALPLKELCDVAIEAAQAAGRLIQSTDRNALQQHFKQAGSSAASQVVTELDLRSEALIRQHLQPSCEEWNIAFVGEESSQGGREGIPERLLKPYYWCVDPLDGTLPFIEGNAGYAVSIALVNQSGAPLMGVICDPVEATLMHAIKGQGAFRGNAPITPADSLSTSLMVFADASFSKQEDHDRILSILNGCAHDSGQGEVTIVYGSGAVKNASQVLDYPAACYLKLPKPEEGGGSIWDFAATACIVSEAGGWVSDIHGEALELNREHSSFMNHRGVIYASNKRIARYLIDRL